MRWTMGRRAKGRIGLAGAGCLALAWLGVAQFGLPGRVDTARDCRASFDRAVADGVLPEPPGDVSAGFQASDDWNGETPVCWGHASTADACHTFSLDIDGRWDPPVWQARETYDHPCSELGS